MVAALFLFFLFHSLVSHAFNDVLCSRCYCFIENLFRNHYRKIAARDEVRKKKKKKGDKNGRAKKYIKVEQRLRVLTGFLSIKFVFKRDNVHLASVISATLTLHRNDSAVFSRIVDYWPLRCCISSPICWSPTAMRDAAVILIDSVDPLSNRIDSIQLTVTGSIYMSVHRLISFEYNYRN